jgi:hypothetical protein
MQDICGLEKVIVSIQRRFVRTMTMFQPPPLYQPTAVSVHNMRKAIFILLTFYSLTVSATVQVCEILKYKTDVICLESYPLTNFYIENYEIFQKKIMGYAEEICISSACWRGYQGYWEINNDSLFLIKLENCCDDKVYDLKKIFGSDNVKNGKVFASWASDTINVGFGKHIGYIIPEGIQEYDFKSYIGYFSKTFYCEINNGIVKNIQISEEPDCDILTFYANQDFRNSKFTLHTNEKYSVENPLPYVFKRNYGINLKYTDSLDYYFCYDSIMHQNLRNKYGSGFMNKAVEESEILMNSGRWIRIAEYLGGQDELYKYFSTKLEQKFFAFSNISYKIDIQFEISLAGKAINPSVKTEIDSEIEKSLIEIIEEMPYWYPAICLRKGYKETINITLEIEDNKLRTLTRGY